METDRIVQLLRKAVSGDPWHGSSLGRLLEGIDAATAARPLENAHSIWEIVLHLTGWTREVARRLSGVEPGQPARGDWPATGPVDEESWSRAKSDLLAAHEELAAALERLPSSMLEERVGLERDAPLGTGVTYREMVLGALQHDSYHGGQISLLKKRRDPT
jgi:uncharacterized damage-inducible protein DinB